MGIKERMGMRAAAMLVTLIVAAAVAQSAAQDRVVHPHAGPAGSWRLLGQTTANFTADHDVIVVRGPFDNFRRIKFKVTDAPLHLTRLIVTYDNGEPDRLDVRERIEQGGESRAIDLRGVGQRSLRKIEFWYDTAGITRGRAKVTVFGMK